MDWKQVRLNLEAPPGWARLDDIDPLTFQAASGLRLRLAPLRVPKELDAAGDAQPLLVWALAQVGRTLGEGEGTRVFPCRFGLCATQTVAFGGGQVRLWLLASTSHVLLVSLHGEPNREDFELALRCVESMHLVPAARYVN